MRTLSHNKRYPLRVLAALFATLYLALSTVGAFTHSHSLVCTEGSSSSQGSLGADKQPAAGHDAYAPRGLEVPTTSTLCAYCEWLSHHVVVTLTPSPAPPRTLPLAAGRYPTISNPTLFLAYFSPRAPPKA